MKTNDQKRLALAEFWRAEALAEAKARGRLVEHTIAVLADESDANATVVLHRLGVPVEPREPEVVMVVMPRADVMTALADLDPELVAALQPPTATKLTILVMQFGGWSVTSVVDPTMS